MKIYRKLVLNSAGSIIEEDSYEYAGPIAECKGGSSTTTTAVPSWQQPYLENIYTRGLGLSGEPIQKYPGTTVAGFTPEQQAAQGWTTQRALLGSPLQKAGQQEALNTIQGNYLDPNSNPWLSQTYETAARDVTRKFAETTMPQIKNAAMGSGAYGGARQGVAEGIAGRGLGTELGDLASKIYGPAYQQERGLQTQMATQAPTMAAADYADISKLAAVGEEQQAMEQAKIDAAIKSWEFSQLEPWQRLGMYSNLVTGDYGGTTSSMSSGK